MKIKLRELKNTGELVSPLALGCMRLPVVDGIYGNIDEPAAIELIRYAIDKGINYIDTAYPYHEETSEALVGKALKNGYREKVHVATKLPSWLIKTTEDMDKYLDEQLQKLDTDCIDFYLIHALNRNFWENLKGLGLFDAIRRWKREGKIKHIGFSFHDELDVFKEIVDGFEWEFCMIQYSFMDENYQAGSRGMKYAADKGLDIFIMEPLHGGSLVNNIPDDIMTIWNSGSSGRSPAQWGFSFIWDKPEVSVILSGMNDKKQIDENLSEAARTTPGTLSAEEKDIINRVKTIYEERTRVNCTNCKYCMPCPAGVEIPGAFTYYNDSSLYQNLKRAKGDYEILIPEDRRASKCVECGQCEEHCPQNIKIIETLKKVAEEFGS